MATFTNEEKYGQAPSITYEQTGVTYDNTAYNYQGQLTTIWVNEPKS
jgi:hypothetical protein